MTHTIFIYLMIDKSLRIANRKILDKLKYSQLERINSLYIYLTSESEYKLLNNILTSKWINEIEEIILVMPDTSEMPYSVLTNLCSFSKKVTNSLSIQSTVITNRVFYKMIHSFCHLKEISFID